MIKSLLLLEHQPLHTLNPSTQTRKYFAKIYAHHANVLITA